jgi:hypothetical protein
MAETLQEILEVTPPVNPEDTLYDALEDTPARHLWGIPLEDSLV